jgi:hypothetical protein
MKTYIDRLRECPLDMLKAKIKRQEAEAEIIKRDLETMNRVLDERTSNAALPPVRSEPLLACSEAMLQAAISRAVENGLLPKYGFPDQTAADWTRMRECVEAALQANAEAHASATKEPIA